MSIYVKINNVDFIVTVTMLEDNQFSQELILKLNQILESLFLKYYREKCYLGLSFQQGLRQMISINIPASDLPILLQAKPSEDNDPDSGKNRPIIKGHADEIKDYLLDRIEKNKPWILGTFTANVDPEKIIIIELLRGLCFVVIPRGVKLDITDGQHRKTAIHDLIVNQEGELIADNDFPITLVLEAEDRQSQIDFRDLAQAKQLDKSLLHSFGEFEGRIGIAKNLIKRVPIFESKTELIKNTPSAKKKLIYTMNYLVRFVSLIFANDSQNELNNYNVEELSESLVNCLNQFFSECQQTKFIFETPMEYLTVEKVTEFREDCILGVSVGLEVLARLLNYCYENNNHYFYSEKISQLAQINWSRNNPLWHNNIVLIDPQPKNPAKPYKISMSSSAIQVSILKIKEQLGWLPQTSIFN